MDHNNKSGAKTQNTTQIGNYNPWNLLFNSRRRTESENSASSNSSTDQTSTQFGSLQRQTSKNNEEYLWMIWRS
ncbi:jg10727 [Pararge aegeria aegeria]|uniref:Jg10727 protein n=2 Tax=Pararge aegeria TaxID=116150 RepID=A0A8S4RGG7_9NEOP|nr:jg10727 [Pararge aegeria aegeria]